MVNTVLVVIFERFSNQLYCASLFWTCDLCSQIIAGVPDRGHRARRSASQRVAATKTLDPLRWRRSSARGYGTQVICVWWTWRNDGWTFHLNKYQDSDGFGWFHAGSMAKWTFDNRLKVINGSHTKSNSCYVDWSIDIKEAFKIHWLLVVWRPYDQSIWVCFFFHAKKTSFGGHTHLPLAGEKCSHCTASGETSGGVRVARKNWPFLWL